MLKGRIEAIPMINRVRAALKTYTSREQFLWARLVSDLFSPPVLWGALAFPIAFQAAESPSQALMWALLYVTLVCVMPLLYIIWMVKRGKISDLHMEVRNQRIKPFIVSLFATTLAWWSLRALGAPSIISQLALSGMIQIAVLAAITLIWQVSMHAMSTGSAVIGAVWVYGGPALLVMIPLLLLVGYARLRLNRHTPAQVVVGAFIGLLIPALVIGMI